MDGNVPGRHRRGRSRSLAWLLALVLVGGAAGAAYAYRNEIDDLVGGEGPATGSAAPRLEPKITPAASPSAEPSPARPEAPPKRRLVIHGTGDVNLDPSYIPSLAANGYGYAWSGLGGLLKKDDLTVVNLECAASDLGAPVRKEFTFRCDTDALPIMRRAGVEVANLANNHSRDFGAEALLDGRRNVVAAGMRAVGVGRNHRRANRPAILHLKGWKIAVLGFGGVIPSTEWLAAPGNPGMADGDDLRRMVRAVRAADRKADLVFVSIHWGVELDTEPRPDDIERAHALIDAGADGIFGHHSHRLQPLDHYRRRPIAWGLGNFVWPNLSEAGSITAVAEFVVTANGRVRGRLIPAYIESAGHPVLRG